MVQPATDVFRRPTLGAAFLYLAAVLWALRAIVPVASSAFPYATYVDEVSPRWRETTHNDQKLSAALIAHNARVLATEPWRIMDGHQCFPSANATTLGEHMIGPGLRAIVPYALTGDPIFTYNVVLVSTHWIAAMAMYALALYWTRSVPAALIAGLLFGLQPIRLADIAHPYVYGIVWAPLALLFAHRLCARGSWRDALGLTLFLGLQLVEGAYPMLTTGLLGGVYGSYLLFRYRARWVSLAPKLIVCGLTLGALAFWVLSPYAETHAIWPPAEDRIKILYPLSRYLWGAVGYPGTILLALLVVGLLDRVRRTRVERGEDPRLVFLTAGVVTLWAAALAVDAFGWRLPNLLTLLGSAMPGLDLVRVGGATESGIGLVGAFLAGYGVLALLEHRGQRTQSFVTGLLVIGVMLEVLAPPLARISFGQTVEMVPFHARPHPKLVALYDTIDQGAVLDIPLESGFGSFGYLGQHVWLGAFHGQPVASCYNSFRTPVQVAIEELARRVHVDPDAGAALYALGFRTVVVHVIVPGRRRPPPVVPLPRPVHLVELGRTFTHTLYRLRSDAAVEERLALLGHVGAPTEAAATPGADAVAVTLTNHGTATYRHARPIVPTRLVARWYDADDVLIAEDTRSVLLPLAMAAGETVRRMVPTAVPAGVGRYRFTVAPAAEPDLVLVDAAVEVHHVTGPS